MEVTDISLELLREAPWNANIMNDSMKRHLWECFSRYGQVCNLVVRPLFDGAYEVLSGNQRLKVLQEMGCATVPCVVVELGDAQARLLSQGLNRIRGEDDLGLRAELLKEVLDTVSRETVLSLLPETTESLQSLVSMGQESMAEHLQAWQNAQAARLKHLQFQLTPSQLDVVEEALSRLIPQAKMVSSDSPNTRGTALFLLCQRLLELEEASP